jgi:hypothetical protein
MSTQLDITVSTELAANEAIARELLECEAMSVGGGEVATQLT